MEKDLPVSSGSPTQWWGERLGGLDTCCPTRRTLVLGPSISGGPLIPKTLLVLQPVRDKPMLEESVAGFFPHASQSLEFSSVAQMNGFLFIAENHVLCM